MIIVCFFQFQALQALDFTLFYAILKLLQKYLRQLNTRHLF